jgi:hypothetical protein
MDNNLVTDNIEVEMLDQLQDLMSRYFTLKAGTTLMLVDKEMDEMTNEMQMFANDQQERTMMIIKTTTDAEDAVISRTPMQAQVLLSDMDLDIDHQKLFEQLKTYAVDLSLKPF